MALMVDILEAALEAPATEVNVWRASRAGQQADLAHALTSAYDEAELEPVPAKEPHEFRPAYLSTMEGGRRDLEREFVSKSLLYADSVAVPDDLALWEAVARGSSTGASFFAEMHVVSVARKIARNASLERHGLLFYVDPLPVGPAEFPGAMDWSVARSLAPLVAERTNLHPDFAASEVAVMPYVRQWLGELRVVLDHVNALHGAVDLFLPDWFAGPELLAWCIERGLESPQPLDGRSARQQAMTRLLRLPTLSVARAERISAEALMAEREGHEFESWRADLSSLLAKFPERMSVEDVDQLLQEVGHREEELRRSIAGSRRLERALGEVCVAGVTTASAAQVLGEPALRTGLIAAAPAMGAVVRAVWKWLVSQPAGNPTVPYRLFIDQNQRGADGRIISQLASTMMYSADTGRPVADFMTEFFDGR